MHRKKQLSPTHEMYLKVLYRVRGEHDVARVRDLASGLGVNPGTVTGVLKKLEQMGFVDHEPYGVVALTPAGNGMAECVLGRFETLRGAVRQARPFNSCVAKADSCSTRRTTAF